MKNRFRKAVCCMVLWAMVSAAYAQDIIVTTDSKKIEAKIMEVSKSEIKYKEADNLEGPTFVLSTDEINTIIYSNGKVVLYNQEVQSTAKNEQPTLPQSTTQPSVETTPTNVATILLRSGYTLTGELIEITNKYVAYSDNGVRKTMPAAQIQSVTLPNGQIKTYEDISALKSPIINPAAQTNHTDRSQNTETPVLSIVSRNGNTYYYEGKPMRGADYELFLQKNCAEAYHLYRKGENIAAAGWTLLACGLGIDLGCTIGALIRNSANLNPNSALIAFSVVGACCEIACIPTLCVGYAKKHRSADTFNTVCANKSQQAYWSINVSQNGIGIAYKF